MRVAMLCISLGLLAGACSKHQPATYQVEIKGMQFVPADLTVHVGDTVVWTNEDIVPHTVTAGQTLASPSIASHEAWRATLTAKGVIDYACSFHPTMKAKLTVK